MDVSILKINSNSYTIKDEIARTSASGAISTANAAKTAATAAQTVASEAKTAATAAQTVASEAKTEAKNAAAIAKQGFRVSYSDDTITFSGIVGD